MPCLQLTSECSQVPTAMEILLPQSVSNKNVSEADDGHYIQLPQVNQQVNQDEILPAARTAIMHGIYSSIGSDTLMVLLYSALSCCFQNTHYEVLWNPCIDLLHHSSN